MTNSEMDYFLNYQHHPPICSWIQRNSTIFSLHAFLHKSSIHPGEVTDSDRIRYSPEISPTPSRSGQCLLTHSRNSELSGTICDPCGGIQCSLLDSKYQILGRIPFMWNLGWYFLAGSLLFAATRLWNPCVLLVAWPSTPRWSKMCSFLNQI